MALAMAMIGSDTESSSECLEEELSDAELWTVLLANFRAACGDSAEQLPPCKILAYLFDADARSPELAEAMCNSPRRAATAGSTAEEVTCCPACNDGANPRMVAEEIRRHPTKSHVAFKAGKEAC
eukprot:s4043_g3.t1